jgi:hypothetical protein
MYGVHRSVVCFGGLLQWLAERAISISQSMMLWDCQSAMNDYEKIPLLIKALTLLATSITKI